VDDARKPIFSHLDTTLAVCESDKKELAASESLHDPGFQISVRFLHVTTSFLQFEEITS
jgi:hypothetical protein